MDMIDVQIHDAELALSVRVSVCRRDKRSRIDNGANGPQPINRAPPLKSKNELAMNFQSRFL